MTTKNLASFLMAGFFPFFLKEISNAMSSSARTEMDEQEDLFPGFALRITFSAVLFYIIFSCTTWAIFNVSDGTHGLTSILCMAYFSRVSGPIY